MSSNDGPTTIGAELRRGQPADVVILSKQGLAELLAEGRIVTGSDVDLASVPLGVGVRAGKPRPDINTVSAFKQTLLQAKSIGIQSTSAVYLKTKVQVFAAAVVKGAKNPEESKRLIEFLASERQLLRSRNGG